MTADILADSPNSAFVPGSRNINIGVDQRRERYYPSMHRNKHQYQHAEEIV
jgi:hypothetical protein